MYSRKNQKVRLRPYLERNGKYTILTEQKFQGGGGHLKRFDEGGCNALKTDAYAGSKKATTQVWKSASQDDISAALMACQRASQF